MAKKTIWQRIKGWFTGEDDKKKKKATPPATRVTMNQAKAQSNSPRRAYIDTVRGKDVKEETRSINNAYKAKKREYADMTKSIDEKLHLTDSGKKQTEYYKNQGSKVSTYQNTKTVKYEPPKVKKAKQNVEAANEAGRSQTEYYKSQGSKANTYQNVKTKKYTPPEPDVHKVTIDTSHDDELVWGNESELKAYKAVRKWLENQQKGTKEFHELTKHKYDPEYWEALGNEEEAYNAKIRIKNGENAADPAAVYIATKYNPKVYSATRGGLSAVTFGGSEIALSHLLTGEQAEAEKYYQEHKSEGAELVGEFIGSLAMFGISNSAAEAKAMQALERFAPNLVERLAKKRLIQGTATRAVNRMVRKGIFEEATEELIEAVGKKKAAQILRLVGGDIIQNATIGAAYDVSRATRQYEWGSEEWKKELLRSALLNLAATGAVAGGSALRAGDKVVFDAAEDVISKAAAKQAPEALIQNADEANRALANAPIEDGINIRNLADARGEESAARRALVAGADAQDEALSRSLVNEGVYGNIRKGVLPPNEVTPSRYVEPPFSRASTRNRLFDRALANAPDANSTIRPIGDLIDLPSGSSARLAQVEKELDEVYEILQKNGSIYPSDEVEALTERFYRLLDERNTLQREVAEEASRASALRSADALEPRARGLDESSEAVTNEVKAADTQRVAEKVVDSPNSTKPIEPPTESAKNAERVTFGEENEYRIEVTLESGKRRKIKVKAENPSEALRKASKRKGVKRAAYLETLNENVGVHPSTFKPKKDPLAGFDENAWEEQRNRILGYSQSPKNAPAVPPETRVGNAVADNTNSRVFKAADNVDSRAAKSVDDFAGVDEDVAAKGFNTSNDARSELQATAKKEAENADLGKSKFEQMRNEAYAEAGTTLNTDGVERMTAAEQRTLIDANWRTTEEHTMKGYTTIAITGDRGYKGVAYNALKNGDTVKNVYHDKDNFGESAQRLMKAADEEGGIERVIDRFERWANRELRLNTDEARLMPYDCITAVDFANANRFIKGTQTLDPQMERLYLAACRAYGEQASVGGLSLRLSHKILMSSPDYRGKAVRDQIVDMFNRSTGMRKMLGKGKGDKILNADELDEILKKNPALKNVLERLESLDAATSADDVEKLASEALLTARRAMPMTVLDQFTQWRYVAMLSSPKTHIRNVTSNIYSATLGQARDAIASQAQKNLVNGRWGKYSKMYKEAVASGKIDENEYFRSAGGMSLKVYKNSHAGVASGFKYNKITNQIDRLNLELKATKDAQAVERITNRLTKLEEAQKVAKKELDDAIAKIESPTAVRAWESWHKMGRDELVSNVEKFEQRLYGGTVSKGIWRANDKASAFVGEALETADALSLERIYREKYEKILLANGWEELSRLAKSGDANAAKRLKLLEEYAAQESAYTAARDTYRNYSKLSQALNKFIADSLFNYDAPVWKKFAGLVAHATFPFTKVPVNLMKRSFDYSPIGLMRAKKALVKAIDAGDVTEINRAVERIAEGRIGTGIAMVGVGFGFADPDGDLIVGRLNDTDYIDRQKKSAGYQNYSANINGTSVSLDWTTPTSSSFFVSVEVGRMLRHLFDAVGSENGLKFDFWEAFDVPMMLMSTTIEPLLQLGMFQGVNDTIESVVKSDNYDDSGTNIHPAIKIVKSILVNYANSMLTPAMLKSLNRAFSPYDYFVVGDTDSEYAFYQQASKVPFLSDALLGAKTNSWGEIKNEKKTAGDYLKAVAKEFSPATLNKITWDDTDKYLAEFYRQTGYKDAFPKNNYDSTVEVGRISGAHDIEMSPKEMAEYNVQRGKAGGEAMEAVLNTVVFNRYSKDDKGHLTIADPDNMSEAEKEALIKQFEGKGIKEVVAWVIKQPAFKNATVAEQKQVLASIYGTNGSGDNKAVGARLASQKYIAQKHGMAAEEYDYYNEVPRRAQESLQPYIDSGLITYQQAVDFCRNAGKTTYSTDEDGEAGGSVTTRYGKQSMSEYLASAGLTEEQNAALYNAFKTSGKDYSGIDLSSGTGRRRRGYGYGGYRRRGGGGRKLKVPALKKSNYKASKQTYKDIASTLKTRSSSIGASSLQNVKVEPPKVKFKKYEV